jgi:hypothetical protein
MVYEYFCSACSASTDVVKSVYYFERDEKCKCDTLMVRIFKPKIYLAQTAVEDAHFHPGLGQVVKSTQHAREIAKSKGLIEVGNEKPDVKWTPKSYD